LGGKELIELGGDSREAVAQAAELVPDCGFSEPAAIHFQEMDGGGQGLANTGQVGAGGRGEDWKRQGIARSGELTGGLEFSLKVLGGDVDIAQSHVDIVVSQQPHENGKAYSEADHLGGIGVAESMGRDRGGATGPLGGLAAGVQ
jgi:hypothetical protein